MIRNSTVPRRIVLSGALVSSIALLVGCARNAGGSGDGQNLFQ